MFARLRSSRLAVVIIFALIAAVSGSILTVTAGAAPRIAFLDPVTELFGLQPVGAGLVAPLTASD